MKKTIFSEIYRTVLKTNNIDNLSNIKAPFLNGLIYKSVIHGFTSASIKDMKQQPPCSFGADITRAHRCSTICQKSDTIKGANLVIANARRPVPKRARCDVRLKYTGGQVSLVNAIMKAIDGNLWT